MRLNNGAGRVVDMVDDGRADSLRKYELRSTSIEGAGLVGDSAGSRENGFDGRESGGSSESPLSCRWERGDGIEKSSKD